MLKFEIKMIDIRIKNKKGISLQLSGLILIRNVKRFT